MPVIRCLNSEISWLEAFDNALNGAAAAPKMREASKAATTVVAAAVVDATVVDKTVLVVDTAGTFLSSISSAGICLIGGTSEGTLAGD